MSKLWFKYGAMNCGKTTKLLQEAHNYEERGMKVLIMKPAIDKKAGDKISSRLGIERKVDILLDCKDSVKEVLNKLPLKEYSCILVDEAQFLEEEQVFDLFVITKTKNIPVMCYGLKTDFKTNFFPGSKRLFELADDFERLKTICACGKLANFNARKVNGKFVSEGDQVAIDGIDAQYESICGSCYLKEVLNIDFGGEKDE